MRRWWIRRPSRRRPPGPLVDEPAECAKLIGTKTTHDHHIMPQQLRSLFTALGIDIDKYTITLRWDRHIGKNGLHSAFDWNGEWKEFFDGMPEPGTLTTTQAVAWQKKATTFALKLVGEAGLSTRRVHPWGNKRATPQPVAKPEK